MTLDQFHAEFSKLLSRTEGIDKIALITELERHCNMIAEDIKDEPEAAGARQPGGAAAAAQAPQKGGLRGEIAGHRKKWMDGGASALRPILRCVHPRATQ